METAKFMNKVYILHKYKMWKVLQVESKFIEVSSRRSELVTSLCLKCITFSEDVRNYLFNKIQKDEKKDIEV